MIFCCCPKFIDYTCDLVEYYTVAVRWWTRRVDISGVCNPSDITVEFSTEEELISQLDPRGVWSIVSTGVVSLALYPEPRIYHKTYLNDPYSAYLFRLNLRHEPDSPLIPQSTLRYYTNFNILKKYY